MSWRSIAHLVEDAAQKYGDKPLFIFGERRLSFGQVNRLANQAANVLQGLGVAAGDRVGVMLPNGVDFPIVWFALAKLRAVLVPININYHDHDLAYTLNDSQTGFFVLHHLGEISAIENYKIVHEPAGSVHTSANDLAQWLTALLQDGAPLLQPATFNELTTPQMVMQDLINSELAPLYYLQPATHFWTYGLGWWVMDYHGKKVLMHGGQMPGYNSAVAFFPQRKLGLAIMVNVHQTLAHASLFYAISDILLGRHERDWSSDFLAVAQGYMAEVKDHVDQLRLTRNPSLIPSLNLTSYTGTFSNPLYGEAFVTLQNGDLNLTYGQLSAVLEHFSADTFMAHWTLKGLQDDTLVSFRPDANGMTFVNDRADYVRSTFR